MPITVPPVVSADALLGPKPPVLHGAGLTLRPWRDRDAPAVLSAFADPDIQRWNLRRFTGEAEVIDWMEERRERWRNGSGANWAITRPAASDVGSGNDAGGAAPDQLDTIVGSVGGLFDLARGSAELSYWIAPAGRGQHTTARALEALSAWAFGEVGLHRLWLVHSLANPASCSVAHRAGFALEGTMRGYLRHIDGWHDMHLHARLTTTP